MMGGVEYIFLFYFALTVAAVLFLFHMLYRIVRAVESFAKTYADKNSNQIKKE